MDRPESFVQTTLQEGSQGRSSSMSGTSGPNLPGRAHDGLVDSRNTAAIATWQVFLVP